VDSIIQAVELSRAGNQQHRPSSLPGDSHNEAIDSRFRSLQLNPAYLETTRIVAHGGSDDPHGRYYDMLRTQVLQEMDQNGWQFLAITSPTAGCGKSVTACNLAMSISRLAGRSVMLVDLDLQKPRISQYLGLDSKQGLLSVVQNKAALSSVVVEASVGGSKFMILPGEACERGSAEWMASQAMSTLLQTIKREFRSRIVIFDMPPVLIGDDVISILPQMDAVLLVAGVGSSSTADIKECRKHLANTPVVRVVVNRVTDTTDAYYGYSSY
jgi:Mrp family chromosome partitioning ATPase